MHGLKLERVQKYIPNEVFLFPAPAPWATQATIVTDGLASRLPVQGSPNVKPYLRHFCGAMQE